ncbi:MAG TPA: response regulator [Longimicrobium sp.]|jgi:CheY-like chemotaxis protein
MKRVLLVDDHEDSRIIYRTALQHAGFSVAECGDGESAVRSARQHTPDLILMDLSLPVLDGWEATRILKADERTRHILIVALTANALPSHRTHGSGLSFDGFLTKPISPRCVVSEIESRFGTVSHDAPAQSR